MGKTNEQNLLVKKGADKLVKSHSSPRITVHTLLLLVSLYCAMFFYISVSYPTPSSYVYYNATPSSHNLTLSEESPIFRYNATPDSIRMEITYLHTNETQVAFSILDESGTLLNVTNVTSIYSLIIGAARTQSGDFWLQVARLGLDADVNMTIQCWERMYAYIDWIFPFYPLLLLTMFLSISVYTIHRLVTANSRYFVWYNAGRLRFMTRIGTASIVLLLILGIVCFAPLTRGHLYLDFVPRLTPQVSYESHNFTLSESFSSWSLELADIYPEAVAGITFNVYNVYTSTYPISVWVSGSPEQELVFGAVDEERTWWLSFTVQTNDSIDLTIQRIDEDVEISFIVKTSYSAYVTMVDPFAPVLFSLIGGSFCILALVLGIRLDSNYKREHSREEYSDPLPIQ